MQLIVWLWNPWDQYRDTRHNLGFIFLDTFREDHNFSEWKYESKFTAEIASWVLHGEKVLLVKPQTFMNLSGESLQKICHYYKLGAENLMVIYDDKDMDFGKVRIREKWSAGWHNGVKSIIKYFGDSWKRIKVWVGKTPETYDTSDWVLSKFCEEELMALDNEIYENISQALKKK